MSKARAYIEDRDRAVIRKWAPIKPDIPFILKKVNDERQSRGLPTFARKILNSELTRGIPEGKTIREYDPVLAKKNYKMGKNKNLPWFDVRSISVLRWFIVFCHLDAKSAYEHYKRLYARETCNIIKLHSVFDVQWLIRHGYANVKDYTLFNRVNLCKMELRGRVPPSEWNLSAIEEYLRKNPNEGKYALYGELPLGYNAVDEVTQVPLPQSQVTTDVSRQMPEEGEPQQPAVNVQKPVVNEKIPETNKDDVLAINLPAGGRIRIVNTHPTPAYEITRNGDEYVIII